VRDGGAYGCAVPRAYANLNPGLGAVCPSHSCIMSKTVSIFSRSLTMVPFESFGVVFYSHSIVTIAISCIVLEI